MNEQQSSVRNWVNNWAKRIDMDIWIKGSERERLLIVAGALLLVSGLAIGYFVGHRQGLSVAAPNLDEMAKIQAQVQQQQTTISALNQTLATTVQERDIALSSSKTFDATLAQQKADQVLVESHLQAYRERLLSIGGIELALQKVEIAPTSQQSVYEYHIDLMQLRQKSAPLRGILSVRLMQGTTTIDVPLTSSKIELNDFQSFTGHWTMPAGFSPEFVEVTANAGGQTVTQRFAWERGAPVKDTSLVNAPKIQSVS